MQTTVFTLYEGHYSYGVGALLNSLLNHNFSGVFVVGFRGSLPVWVDSLEAAGDHVYTIGKVRVRFIPVDTPMHLTYYKPYFGLELIRNYEPATERLFYFDPDVVIKTDWSFLESWATKGVALCLDNCFQLMPYNHPWRHEWIKIGERIGLSLKTQQNFYCNAGFFGLSRQYVPFLELWTDLTDSYRDSDGDVATMKKVSRTSAVVGDQDLLNAAMMYTDVPLSIIGPEGMDFGGGGYLMSHAVYNIKPWKRRFLAELIRSGNIPSSADKEFMKNISSPIKVFPVGEERFKKVDMKLASVLGRLIGH